MGYQRDDPVPAHAEAVCQISLACGAHVYAWVDDCSGPGVMFVEGVKIFV